MLKEYDVTKKEIKDFNLIIWQCYHIAWSVEKKADSKHPKLTRTNKGNLLILSKRGVRDTKKLRVIKEQEASGLLINLGIKIFKDLPGRTASDKVFYDKAFNNAKNPKYDRYQRGLTSMIYKVFYKKFSGANTCATRAQSKILTTGNKFAGGTVKCKIMSNQKLSEDLHKY